MDLIQTAPHEYNANYNFADGLRGYFATDSVVKENGGIARGQFRHNSEDWRVKLYYQDSGIQNPGNTTPFGTPFKIESVREFRFKVESADDPTGERGFNAHLRPRWDGMEVENEYGDTRNLSVPFDEGINVRFTGSNIEFTEYLPLLQQAAISLDLRWDFFESPHQSSNVQQAERYVRLHRDESGPVHARDGPLARIGHLLENDRDGHRKVEQRDMDERGDRLPGYRHQSAVDENRVQEILPNQSLPKRWKHYYAREAAGKDESDPLAHPKVGAIYQSSLWKDKQTVGVTAAELDQLTNELNEGLLSVLHDAGLDVSSSHQFVSDAYFEATVTDQPDIQVVDLPLSDIEQRQESVVIQHVADGLSPVQWQALETLVTDGGEVAPADVAQEGGFHQDSVYRALDDMEELIEREYGALALRSTHVGQLVHDAVDRAKESVRDAVEAGAKVVEASERGLDESTSALLAWQAQHLEGFRETEHGVTVDFGTLSVESVEEAKREIRKRLREGYDLWTDARKDETTWRLGTYKARVEYEQYPDANYLSNRTRQTVKGQLHKTVD